jgi:hypothetical protein
MQKEKMNTPGYSSEEKLTNIHHCTIHKAGSQWIKGIFSDTRIKKITGLEPYEYVKHLKEGYDKRKIHERFFDTPFPEGKVLTPLYIGYDNYRALMKPRKHRGIFVMRDPRDLVVSNYFSKKFSHPVQQNPGLLHVRQKLNEVSTEEGFKFIIDNLKRNGTFDSLRSWANAPEDDENLLVLRFEDLTGDNSIKYIKKMFEHLKILMPDKTLKEILNTHSFEKLSGGRKQGQELPTAHYRKGVHGDWKRYFDKEVKENFTAVTEDLTDILGYESAFDYWNRGV